MTYLLKDLDSNPRLLESLRKNKKKCPYCGVILQETVTGKRPTPKGEACSDCHYGLIGEEVEKSPIASGGIRRG